MAITTLFSKHPSQNAKLSGKKRGAMWSTYRPVTKTLAADGTPLDGTCPKDCPLLTKCYANFSFTNIIQKKALERADNLIERIKALPIGATIRHLVSGDFGQNDKLDDYLDEAIAGHKARPDILGFSYTHHWRNFKAKRFNKVKNLVINASCETDADVRKALKAGWPAVQVVPIDTPDKVEKDGFRLVVCPAQTKNISCADCMLCARPNRAAVIGFRAHGNNKKDIAETVKSL